MDTIMVTPNTKIYTWINEASGYTLLESVLGNQTPEQYVTACEGDDDPLSGLCGWLEDHVGEGFYMNQHDANNAEHYPWSTLTEFTPAEFHDMVISTAK